MAEHLRTKQRKRIAALIDAATTATVRISPAIPVDEASVPAVDIETTTDAPSGIDTGSWPVQFREHELTIKIQVRCPSIGVSNTLDDLAGDIEAALAADPTLNGTAKLTRLLPMEYARDELDLAVGVLTQTWLILYRVNATNPTTLVD
jgi:hypothetical protein